MARDARELRAARRAAKLSAGGERQLPRAVTSRAQHAGERYARAVLDGRELYPQPGTPEARQLARYASYSSWGKADPQYLAAFSQYFYHDELHKDDEPEEYDEEDEEEEDYEE